MTVHPMDDRTVVITGGNSGIGLETAVGLAAAGARVVLGCRNATKAATALADIRRRSGSEEVEVRSLDLADLRSVEHFAADLGDLDRIDVLINNAGLMLDERRETAQGFEMVFGTNHVGHFHLTNLLAEHLRAAPRARILSVASDAHRFAVGGLSWSRLDRHGSFRMWQVYGESKLANILHSRALATRFEGTGVVAHSLHPGAVGTNFGKEDDTKGALKQIFEIGNPLLLTPAQGARTSIHVASAPAAGRSNGLYWVREKPARPNRWARERGAPERLWAVTSRMVAAAS